jgi:hypothetical protein
MSGPSYTAPAQPTYGEGMADAMKAQMEQLLGQGDFADIYANAGFEGGNLGDIIREVEAPLRQQTAQTDTDVLRQTLLGNQREIQVEQDPDTGKFGIAGAEVVKGEDGEPQTAGGGRYQMVQISEGKEPESMQLFGNRGDPNAYFPGYTPKFAIVDTDTGGIAGESGGAPFLREGMSSIDSGVAGSHMQSYFRAEDYNKVLENLRSSVSEDASLLELGTTSAVTEFNKLREAIDTGGEEAVAQEFTFENPYTGEPLEEGQTVTIRDEDGMIDLLGDRRNVQEFATRQATQEDVDAGLASEVGDSITEQVGNRQAGFDESGKFLGLSAMAEDIQRGNLSRQREADLADVERLSGRFQSVMEDYKPAATSGIQGAKDLIEEQKDKLTSGDPTITIPTTDTYGGDVTGRTMTAATIGDTPTLSADTSFTAASVADPLALNAETSYTPSASVTGDGYTATANLQGGNIGADALRAALLADAESALSQGLTEREQANISNAARARDTLMGRTFDQSGAIKEAQALVAEDNNRLMQNRGFAQSALGQEVGIQQDDLTRGLQANMQNQSALNRAAEFGASQSMQAQLANQAATNQASQAGMTAGLSQEALAAQQKQAQALANQAASNQALQFGASTSMDAQRLNQAATNQALQAGMQAKLSQEALGAQQAQAKAMADAEMLQQSRAMGLEADMQQDAQQAQFDQQANLAKAELQQQANAFGAQSAQQADLVNQGQAQQAAQFGVGATMDAERLNEQLRQQGLGNYINAVGNLAQIEDQHTLDPFQAILGRAGGGSLQAGQGVFGQAGYGLNSGPQYLNPEAGLGYISQMAANDANMYAAQVGADASRFSGLMSGLGSLGGGAFAGAGAAGGFGSLLCWVAREVYGPTNPAWLQFREWMFTESPGWFFKLYRDYGERFANWVSDKPRIKSIIRKWMDSKIRR